MRIAALALLALAPTAAHAGLHYSGEVYTELPAQWRGVLLDQRNLRAIASTPATGLPSSLMRTEYHAALAALEKRGNSGPDDLADLGALLIRTGQPAKAVELLRTAHRRHPQHFRIAANLGTAWQLQGDLDQSAESLRAAIKLAPPKLRSAEELHLKLVLSRKKSAQGLDDLFGVRFVGEKGEWVPGMLVLSERKKLPPDAIANVQKLALWLPSDARLLWQMGELANAYGDVRTAAAIFDGLVGEFGMTTAIVRERRLTLRAAVEKMPPASRNADTGHGEQHQLAFRSPRPLMRRFDIAHLPTPSADRPNPLPWDLLADTVVDARFRATFPEYVKKVDGKTVSVTGFMQPLGDAFEVTSFLLIEFPVGCWFCDSPPPTGLLLVELPADKSVMIRRGLVKVEGKLKINATDPEDFLFTLREATISDPD